MLFAGGLEIGYELECTHVVITIERRVRSCCREKRGMA
jgi:hypothetical protein